MKKSPWILPNFSPKGHPRIEFYRVPFFRKPLQVQGPPTNLLVRVLFFQEYFSIYLASRNRRVWKEVMETSGEDVGNLWGKRRQYIFGWPKRGVYYHLEFISSELRWISCMIRLGYHWFWMYWYDYMCICFVYYIWYVGFRYKWGNV